MAFFNSQISQNTMAVSTYADDRFTIVIKLHDEYQLKSVCKLTIFLLP